MALVGLCFACYFSRVLDLQQEKAQQNLLQGLETFNKSALKPTDTVEKLVLPDPEGLLYLVDVADFDLFNVPLTLTLILMYFLLVVVIAQEKGQQQLLQGIESFDTNKLKRAETQEKNPLPTQEGKRNGNARIE